MSRTERTPSFSLASPPASVPIQIAPSRPARRQRIDVAREAVGAVEDGEAPAVEAGDARPVGPGPDVSPRVERHGVDDVGREAVLLREARQLPAREADEPGAVRPDPEDVPRRRDERIGPARPAAPSASGGTTNRSPRSAAMPPESVPTQSVPSGRPRDRADVLVGEPLARAVDEDLPVAEAVQPAVRPDPDAPLAVLADRADEGVRETLGHAEPLDAVLRDPGEPGPVAPDPQGSVPVAVERPEKLAREAVLPPANPHRPVLARLHEAEAVERRRDAARRRARGSRRRRGPGPSFGWIRRTAFPSQRRSPSADVPIQSPPDGSPRRLRIDGRSRVPGSETGRNVGPVEAGEAAVGTGPERAAGVLGEGPRVLRREPFALAVAREDAPARADDASAERPDPERPEAILEERPGAVALQGRRVPRVVDDEGDAVETDEPFVRPEPEVALPRLEDRVDAVLRKPVLPGVEAVLRERRRGVEGGRAARDKELRDEGAEREEPAGRHPVDSDAEPPPARGGGTGRGPAGPLLLAHPFVAEPSGSFGRRLWKSVALWNRSATARRSLSPRSFPVKVMLVGVPSDEPEAVRHDDARVAGQVRQEEGAPAERRRHEEVDARESTPPSRASGACGPAGRGGSRRPG